MKTKRIKKTIGRFEAISFPDFDLGLVNAKIDTGADSCAIHCSHIKLIEKNGAEQLAVKLLDKRHKEFTNKFIVFDEFKERRVKNSFGLVESRYAVKTNIQVGDDIINTDVTFATRSLMNYEVLLGRKFLKGVFVVDVARRYLLSHHIKED